MSLSEAIYGVIFSPKETLAQISRERIWLTGVLIFVVIMTFNMVINISLAGIEQVEQVVPIPANFFWIMSIIGLIFSLLMLFIMAGLYSLLGEIIYQASNSSGLLASLSFASIPAIFGPPLQYVAVIAGLNQLSVIISLLVGIWVISLQVIAIREALNLSTSQAIVLFIIPLITCILIIGVFLVAAISAIPLYK